MDTKTLNIDYEDLVGKLKKHLKRLKSHVSFNPGEYDVRYFVYQYLYKIDDIKNAIVDPNDPLTVEVTNILYDLHPRIRQAIDRTRKPKYTTPPPFGTLSSPITMPKIKAPWPDFPTNCF